MKFNIRPTKVRRGTSSVFAGLLLILVVFAFGIGFFHFVMSEVDFAKKTFNTQMVSLLLKSVAVNATHLIVNLQNVGASMIEITSAYVNGMIATIATLLNIEPNSIGAVILLGTFAEGSTYMVKLNSFFDTVITFKITY